MTSQLLFYKKTLKEMNIALWMELMMNAYMRLTVHGLAIFVSRNLLPN